jgi:chorismate lyase/3-hydroxybenzoate synthase
VSFGKPPRLEDARVPVTASMTAPLRLADDLCEVWRIAGRPMRLSNGAPRQSRVHYRYCEDLLFGSITLDERLFGPGAAAHGGIDDAGTDAGALLSATEMAYREIFAVLRRTGHRHLIRIWNYLPEINREAGGEERYRLFNSARQLAFRQSGQATAGTVPAACALGSAAGSPISIYFLAARQPPKMIENPRQTSAYHYPPKFGRHSPTFSRACVLNASAGTSLFVSGTASIVGHETIHRGDVDAQTRETMANINALLDEANRVVGPARYSLDGLKFKVYVRRPSDLGAIEGILSRSLRPSTPIVYLQADVCREDLLVEIEATGEPAPRPKDLR